MEKSYGLSSTMEHTQAAFMGQAWKWSYPSIHVLPRVWLVSQPHIPQGGWEGSLATYPGRTGSGFWHQPLNICLYTSFLLKIHSSLPQGKKPNQILNRTRFRVQDCETLSNPNVASLLGWFLNPTYLSWFVFLDCLPSTYLILLIAFL